MSDRLTRPIDTADWPPAARRYVARLQAIIERDRTMVARGVTAVRRAIVAREWLRLGRGSYEYDDDRWRDEFGAAIEEIEEAINPLRAVAANLNDSPVDANDVADARLIPMNEPDFVFHAEKGS